MTSPDHAPRDAERAAANLAKAEAIQDLLIGPDREAFQTFQNRVSRFCPFEAIGMVHQEIRHAHFLSFLLDPNRPHAFQDEFLKLFLQQIVAEAKDGQAVMQPLEVHCADFNSAQVYRERADIDILIEVPPLPGGFWVSIRLTTGTISFHFSRWTRLPRVLPMKRTGSPSACCRFSTRGTTRSR